MLSSRSVAASLAPRSAFLCATAARCSRLRGQSGLASAQRGDQRAQRLPRVANQPDLDRIVAPDFLRVDLDLHDRHVGRNDAVVVEGAELGQPRARGEDEIRALQHRLGLGRARAPDRTHDERVLGRNHVVARIRGHHAGREHPGEFQQFVPRARIAHAEAGDEDRPLGAQQCRRRRGHGLRVRGARVFGAVARRREHIGFDILVEQIPGQVDMHRTLSCRSIAMRNACRKSSGIRSARGTCTLHLVSGRNMATWSISWNESRYCCETIGAPVIAISGEWLSSATDSPGGQVGRAGSVGGHAYARLARNPRVAVGHVGRTLLVARAYPADVLPVVHVVEDLDHARAHDAEDVAHVLGAQRLDHRAPA